MVFYQGVSDTNVSDKCIFHPTHRRYLQKKRNFEFILTNKFLKNFDKKKKKKDRLGGILQKEITLAFLRLNF